MFFSPQQKCFTRSETEDLTAETVSYPFSCLMIHNAVVCVLSPHVNDGKSFVIPLLVCKVATDRPRSYNERLRLCKVLRGFQLRTVTINRAIAYMSSGEHIQ